MTGNRGAKTEGAAVGPPCMCGHSLRKHQTRGIPEACKRTRCRCRLYQSGADRPRICAECGGNLTRATDWYVVVCGMCGADFTVDVPNDYLLTAPPTAARGVQ